ncbi:MAG: hypothetical protein WCI77_04350 [Candidatus Omnitrophota bacterium]
MLDFTVKILMELYTSLLHNGYQIVNVSDFLQKKYTGKTCILRHDVDRGMHSALRLAQTEKRMGISASYYFRYPQTFNENIIKEIYNLNHDIGYHYEVLAKAGGNYGKAIELFKKELGEFQNITAVKTICAHGSPFSKWDNKKLWEKYNFIDLGIMGETCISMDFNKIFYLTDTGRSWNADTANIRDKVNTKFAYKFNNTCEIMSALKRGELPDGIMLNIHPNRWNDDMCGWAVEFVGQNIRNLFKMLLQKARNS